MTNNESNLHWKNSWNAMRKERMRPSKVTFDSEFNERVMHDQFQVLKSSNYEYGRKAVKVLKVILKENHETLEIGPGPGTLTIPLAKNVKKVIAVECSELAASYLAKNMKEHQLTNIEVVNKRWEELSDSELKDRFDLVVCSHFLWQVKDLEEHLRRMENASRKHCVVIQPAGRDSLVREAWTEVTRQDYRGQLEPDADFFVYLVLRKWGRLVNVKTMEYSIERNLDQEARHIAFLVGKHIEVNANRMKAIENYIHEKKGTEQHKEQCCAVVMWWTKE